MFENPAENDFRLKEGSPVFRLGFQPIDISKIGLYGEDEWVKLPEKYQRIPCPLSKK